MSDHEPWRDYFWSDEAQIKFDDDLADSIQDTECEAPGTYFPKYSDTDIRAIAEALGAPIGAVLEHRSTLELSGSLFKSDSRFQNSRPPPVLAKDCETDLVALRRFERRLKSDGRYLTYVIQAAEDLAQKHKREAIDPTAAIWDIIKVVSAAQKSITKSVGQSAGVRDVAQHLWACRCLEVFERILGRPAGRSRPGGPFTRGLQAAARPCRLELTPQEAFRLVGQYKREKARMGIKNVF